MLGECYTLLSYVPMYRRLGRTFADPSIFSVVGPNDHDQVVSGSIESVEEIDHDAQ